MKKAIQTAICLKLLAVAAIAGVPASRPVMLPLIFEPGAAGGFVGRNTGGNLSMMPAQIDFGTVRMRFAGARPHTRREGLDACPASRLTTWATIRVSGGPGSRSTPDGARRLAVEPGGDLRIESSQGILRQRRPVVYQEIRAARIRPTSLP